MQTLLAGGDVGPMRKNGRRRKEDEEEPEQEVTTDGSHVWKNNNAPNARRIPALLHMRKFK